MVERWQAYFNHGDKVYRGAIGADTKLPPEKQHPAPRAVCVAVSNRMAQRIAATYHENSSGPAANISGKWEFDNGMNINLTQNASLVTGISVYQTAFSRLPTAILIEPCLSTSGTVSLLTVTLHSGTCGGGVTPTGGYSTTTSVNVSGTLMTGGAWGSSFKVPSTTGEYSGTMTFYRNGGIASSSTVTLNLAEEQDFNVIGTLDITNGGLLSGMRGYAVGGTINLNNGELVGVIQQDGGIQATVTCNSGCLDIGVGLLR